METSHIFLIGAVMTGLGIVGPHNTDSDTVNLVFDTLFLIGALHIVVAAGRYVWDNWL